MTSTTKELEHILKLLGKKDGLAILFKISDGPKQFKDLPSNMNTRSHRLSEMKEANLIEMTLQSPRRGKPVVVYRLTEKGKQTVAWLEGF